MTKEEQKGIFNLFRFGNKNIRKNFGGSGLGLWLAKRNIELLGGWLNIISKKN